MSSQQFRSLFWGTSIAIVLMLGSGMEGMVRTALCQDLTYAAPKQICKLENRKVNESSGLSASRRDNERFWTHNDSGDKPRLYCFDIRGNHLGTMDVKKAEAVDWEDMCSFDVNGKPRLLIADTGDNGAKRKSHRLYLIEEPSNPDSAVKPIQEIKLKYSSGPMDCEAIGVDSVGKKILFVEKRRWLTCRVFIANLPSEKEDKVKLTAEPIAKIDIPLVTGMDVSSDGRRAIVLTLGQAFEFSRNESEAWSDAFQRKPRTIDMPPRKQGEAICYGRNGRDLYLTSEFAPCPLFLVEAIYREKTKQRP